MGVKAHKGLEVWGHGVFECFVSNGCGALFLDTQVPKIEVERICKNSLHSSSKAKHAQAVLLDCF